MYPNLQKKILCGTQKAVGAFNEQIKSITCEEALDSAFYKRFIKSYDKRALQKKKASDLVPDDIAKRMFGKFRFRVGADFETYLCRLKHAGRCEVPESFSISVKWKREGCKMRYMVNVRANDEVTRASTTGDTYYKEGSATALAINKNPNVMRILYDAVESGADFGDVVICNDLIPIPTVAAKVSIGTICSLFKSLGYEYTQSQGRGGDTQVYSFVKPTDNNKEEK